MASIKTGQVMQIFTDGGKDGEKIIQGRRAQAKVTAWTQDETSEDRPTNVVVTEYNCRYNVKLIDSTGYRPQPERATKPLYVSGVYATTSHPLEFFDVGLEDGPREIAVTCEAINEASKQEWDASVTTTYEPYPLTKDPLNFVENTTMKDFALSDHLYFGFGTRENPGFEFKQKAVFEQSGYFGVIQLIRGTYMCQPEGPGNWQYIKRIPEYVLDTPQDTVNPVTPCVKVAIGDQEIEFKDAPGLDLAALLQQQLKLRGVQIHLQFKTYFMFNPSASADPNTDKATTWYPIGGLEWECGAKIRWTGDMPRTDPAHWKFLDNYHDMLPTPINEYPEWTGRLHAAPIRDTSARGLQIDHKSNLG